MSTNRLASEIVAMAVQAERWKEHNKQFLVVRMMCGSNPGKCAFNRGSIDVEGDLQQLLNDGWKIEHSFEASAVNTITTRTRRQELKRTTRERFGLESENPTPPIMGNLELCLVCRTRSRTGGGKAEMIAPNCCFELTNVEERPLSVRHFVLSNVTLPA